jgi:agmatinase
MTMHEPTDALASPRFTGVRTFARLPHIPEIDGADAAVFGMPWDGGTSFRSGSRFGPEAIRSASALLRPFNPAAGVMVFGNLSVVDAGDAPTVPGYIEHTLPRIEEYVTGILDRGAVPIGMGGDHSVALAELRAAAKKHGPLAYVQLDAHHDLWDQYNGLPYNHGTFAKRAIEEGLIDPAKSLQAGQRGSLYGPEDYEVAAELGIRLVPWQDLRHWTPAEFGAAVAERAGDTPLFFSFDIDFVDPGIAPGTGTPEVGGPSADQALDFIRALKGVNLVGADVVEVAPQYDGPGQQTALMAANVIYEMLSLLALKRQ